MEYFHSAVPCGVSAVDSPVRKQVNPTQLSENKLFMFDTIFGFEAEFCVPGNKIYYIRRFFFTIKARKTLELHYLSCYDVKKGKPKKRLPSEY